MAVIGVYLAAGLLVYANALAVFFAQDDFILIREYTSRSLGANILHLFAYPSVSHFRPMHYLYLLVSESLFGQSYQGYHLVTILLLVYSSVLVYLALGTLTKSKKVGFAAGFFYAVSAVHFNSVYWISGSATLIGFALFITSFYLLLRNRRTPSILVLFLSFLASESLLMGVPILIAYAYIFKIKRRVGFTAFVGLLAVFSAVARLLFLTQVQTFAAYRISLTSQVMQSVKYYAARLLGLSESSGDLVLSSLVIVIDLLLLTLITLDFVKVKQRKIYLLAVIVILCGLFPFVLIPGHLAANYLSLSFLGVCLAGAVALRRVPMIFLVIILAVWMILQVFVVRTTGNNTWITKRAQAAKNYLVTLKRANIPAGSTVLFKNNPTGDILETYVVLGGGRALDFWFPDKNYKYCFAINRQCPNGVTIRL